MIAKVARFVLRYVFPVVVILAGVLVARFLVQTKPEPQKAAPSDPGVLVEVVEVRQDDRPLQIDAQGIVLPARRAGISPQVSGRVVSLHPSLVPGGRVAEGDVLLEIEQSDYRAAVEQQEAMIEQQEASLARAEAALRMERGRAELARREWARAGRDEAVEPEARALALREPQLRDAEAQVEAAEAAISAGRAALRRMRQDLRRTTLEAPFDAFVQSESVEIGQLVSPQAVAAVLVGVDSVWVEARVPVEQLPRISIPTMVRASGEDGDSPPFAEATGSPVEIRRAAGTAEDHWSGTVTRLLPELDPGGRLARVVIEVHDPFDVAPPGTEGPRRPLLVNSYVRARIEGTAVESVYPVPRVALRDGDRVFVATPDDTLEIRHVEIGVQREEIVLVTSGLSAGERVVVSPIGNPVNGLRLRTSPEGSGGRAGPPGGSGASTTAEEEGADVR